MAQILEFPNVLGSGSKSIDAAKRLECLLMAEANEERAELCTADQPALKKFFALNAQLLREIARD